MSNQANSLKKGLTVKDLVTIGYFHVPSFLCLPWSADFRSPRIQS